MKPLLAIMSSLAIGACIPAESPPPQMPPSQTSPPVAAGPGGPAPGAGHGGGEHNPTPGPATGPTQPGTQQPGTSEQPSTGTSDDPMRVLEAEIVVAMNRLRANPKAFAAELETYRSYYDDRGYINYPGREVAVVSNEGVAAVDEAIKVAKESSRADQMKVSAGLTRAAQEHAAEIGAAGTIDHRNSKMEQPHHRMERYGVISGYSGENIGTGDAGGTNMVISLFVDDGVPSRGHRTNLLTKAFRFVGVGCAPHIHWEIVCVIDTAEGYRER